MVLTDSLFDALTDGVCVSDKEGNILYLNPAAKRMLDAPENPKETLNSCELLCGRLFSAGSEDCAAHCALREPESRQNAVTFAGRHGPRASYEWRDFKVNRAERWAHLRVRCLKAPGRFMGLGDEERHFTLIEDSSPEADLQRHKEDWRNMIAHDLRNPLSAIFAALVAAEEFPMESKEKELLEIGVRNCRRMTELLDLYLEVAKFDAGAMPVDAKPVSVNAAAKACVEEMSPLARAKGVEVSVECGPELAVKADPRLFARILQNLLSNSLKFTPKEGKIVISAVKGAGETVSLTVKDTGAGIAPEELPFIFDRFHHAQARREQRIQGNGLGLTFCQEALKAMGGKIDVKSKLGSGSEFNVELPAAAISSPKRSAASR